MKFVRAVLLTVALLLGISASAFAGTIMYTGHSGDLAAEAVFEVQGTNLVVKLTNTSMDDVMVPADVLTAVFFSGVPSGLMPLSAVLSPGSSVVYGGTDPGGSVGGEWGFACGLGASAPGPCGISSSGLGLFGPGNLFPGNNLQGPTNPDGLQYGITSKGDNATTGNSPVTGDNALIKNSVIFTLSGLPEGFNASNISGVQFQYGTALSEPRIPGDDPGTSEAPEPGTTFLAGAGLLAVVLLPKLKKK